MAIDLADKPYDSGQIIKSTWDIDSNTVMVSGASGAEVATEATLLDVLQAVQDLEPNASLSAVGVPVRLDYSGTNVTSAAYVTLQADTGATAIRQVNIFDSSGYTIYLAFGAAASESNKIMICPGGPGQIPLSIPANTRLSLKAVSTSATAGEIVVSFFG